MLITPASYRSLCSLTNNCDAPSALPTAFYWLFSLLKRHGYRHDRVLPLLAHQDIQRLVVGGLAIDKLLLRAFTDQMGLDEWSCQDRESPCGACHLDISLWWGDLLADFGVHGPLESLKFAIEELKEGDGNSFQFGNPCRNLLVTRLEHLRTTIFGNLQLCFSLPSATGVY
jgi:hypothetical protein